MNTREILKYAKDNGYNSVKFILQGADGKTLCCGKFLDAYYEFVEIPILGGGFSMLSDLEERLGYGIQFEVIDDNKFATQRFLDFVLRGKEVTSEVREAFEKASKEGAQP